MLVAGSSRACSVRFGSAGLRSARPAGARCGAARLVRVGRPCGAKSLPTLPPFPGLRPDPALKRRTGRRGPWLVRLCLPLPAPSLLGLSDGGLPALDPSPRLVRIGPAGVWPARPGSPVRGPSVNATPVPVVWFQAGSVPPVRRFPVRRVSACPARAAGSWCALSGPVGGWVARVSTPRPFPAHHSVGRLPRGHPGPDRSRSPLTSLLGPSCRFPSSGSRPAGSRLAGSRAPIPGLPLPDSGSPELPVRGSPE